MKPWFAPIGRLVLFALLAAACGGAQGPVSSTPGQTRATSAAPTTTRAPTSTLPPSTTSVPVPVGPYEHLGRARLGEYAGTVVELAGHWLDGQGESFEAALRPFVEATGINVHYEGIPEYSRVLSARARGGTAPDIATIPEPGLMRSLAAEGLLVGLSDWFNLTQLEDDYLESFVDLASFRTELYGVFYRVEVKSIVWYPVEAFAERRYQIPTTWEELIALSDRIVADGSGHPWCIAIEHGSTSGWVATDWLEDILLRVAPIGVYDRWAAHEIPFDSPAVVDAAGYMGRIWFQEDYVDDGVRGITSAWVGNAQTPMFTEGGPQCWLHKQAAWIPSFWPEGMEPGIDSAFFPFPPIDPELGNPVLGRGDMVVMFEDRPEVRALMEYLATADGARPWVEAGGLVSPNRTVPLDWYPDYVSRELAAILAAATKFRPDASDGMPPEVGGGSFREGMAAWVASTGGRTSEILRQIDESWPGLSPPVEVRPRRTPEP